MAILSLEDAFLPPAKSSGSSGLLSLAEAFAKPEPINAEIDPAIYDLMSGTPIGLTSLPTPKKVGSVFERLTPEQIKELPSAKPLPPPTSPERRAYDSATPEERNLLVKKFPKIKSLDEAYKEFDEQALAKKGPITDIIGEQYNFDTRLENRARALRAQGLDPEFAEGTAKMMAQQGYQGNQSPYGVAKAAGPEYDIEREYRISPEMGDLETAYMIAKRGITKAGVGIVQGGGGINRFLGDTLGLDTSSTQKTLEGLDRYVQSMGDTTSNPARLFEAATTSIFQNLPAIAGSVVTGSTVPALASMFTSSFGQTYDQSRRNGLGYGDATARSTAFASLEVLGESLGLGTQIDIIKNALKKVPTRDLPDAISKTLTDYVKNTATREVPGELFTYTGQFATDKVFAQNEQAGFKDFIKGAMDTVAVTAIQGAVMGSGTAGAQKIINQFNRVTPDAVPTAKELLEQNGFSFEKKQPKEVEVILDKIPPARIEPTLNLDNIPQRIEPTLREPTLQPTPESVVQPTPEIVREEPVSGNVATQPITPTKTLGYESESQDLESALAELRGEIVPTKVDKFDTPSIVEGLQTFEVPVADLSLSKDVPQFKSGASKEGVVEALGGKFDRTGVAPIQVWERLDGNLEIISGRHRFDLAKRSGEQTIPAQVHREADGFNVEQAASLDALLNIREGQGKVKDYVQFFQRPGYSREEAESSGVLARATGKRAFSIATNGVSDLVASHRADLISDEAATQIAETAPQDAALQNLGMKAVMDGKSITNSINLMQAVKSMTGDRESTGDLFGFDDSAMREAEQMADYASKIQRELGQRLSAITGAARKPEIARAEGIDVKDEVAVRNRIDELRQAKAKWDRWSSFPELIGEIRAGLKLGVNKPIEQVAPKEFPEIIESFPMGENAEFRVMQNDQGFIANLYDKDAEKYLDTSRVFPTKTFGDGAKDKAIKFAKEESEKAAKYNAPEEVKTQADINKERQAAKREKAPKKEVAPKNLNAETRERIVTGMRNIVTTQLMRDTWADELQNKLNKNDELSLNDIPENLRKLLDSIAIVGVTDGFKSDPQTTIDLIRRKKEKFELKTTTPEELKKEEDVKAEKQKEEDKKTKEAESKVKKEVEKKEIADRSVGAAEDFKLGQTAEENLTGQKDIFGEDLFGGDQPAKKEQKLSKKEQARKDLLEDHFGVGNIIKSDYWGTYDRVIDFDWNNGAWTVNVIQVKEKDGKWVDAGRIRDHSTFPDRRDVIVQRGQNEPIINKDEDEGVPGSFVDTTVKDFAQKALDDFLVGDEVKFGTVSGVVVGLEGDYVKFRPFTSKNPKAYQKIPKKSIVLVARYENGINVSTTKNESTKFGSEAGQLNADMAGLVQLLGANMYSEKLVDVTIKELLQNAFDAVKGAISNKKSKSLYKSGQITIDLNPEERTIKITDNARGMSIDTVKNALFTVAGSDKSDLDPSERSGGLGLAKMGFMMGAQELRLDTVKDGVRIKVNTTGEDIARSNFKIEKSPAPKDEHGTSIEIKIPENYIDPKNGDKRPIYFWRDIESIPPLNQPLIGPVEVRVNLTSYGDTETKVLPVGINYDEKATPLLTKADFDWGTADIYFGVSRKDNPKHQVLSSGVYQFNGPGKYASFFKLSPQEKIPFDIVVNVKPNVDAKHPDYPFENSREAFKSRISKDIESLEQFLARVARGEEAKDLKESFEGIVSMPRVEVGEDIADVSKKLRKIFDQRGATQEQTKIPEMPKEISIRGDVITDMKGTVLYDKAKEEEKNKESSFKAEKEAPKMSEFMIDMKQDPKLPIFHNNTNVDFIEVGRQYGDPEKFFAELGTLMVEMKEELGKSDMYGYEILNPENLFFGGISVDKGYGGVHIKVPYKAILLNPFYEWGAQSLFGVRQNFLNTMIHEVAHTGNMDHGVGHNNQMIRVEQYLADQGLLDYYRDAILDILSRHESTFTAMKEEYAKSTTKNTAKSLEDYGKKSASDGGDRGGSADQISAVSARTGQGGSGAVPPNAGGNKASKVGGGSNKQPKTTGVSGSTIVISGRRNYAGGTPPLASWSAPTGSKLDSIIYTLQNKLIDTKRVQEEITKAGNDIEQDWDAYLKEELYHGRTAKQSMDFIDKELLPVIKELRKNGLTVEDFEEYLQNRHAEERNAQVAKVNPNLPDGGSGITNADARNYINQMLISNLPKFSALTRLANKVDSIINKTQDLLVSSGLEEQATIDKWRDTYKYYVPLNREDLDFSQKLTGTGSGFSTKGGSSKRAMGSTKGVVDIFANIAMQRERAIIRAEKSKVGRALYGLAITNPNPDFWLPVNPDAVKNKSKLIAELVSLGVDPADAANIIAEPKTPYIDPLTGLVSYRVNPILRNSDNVFPIRVNGKDRYIFFNPNDPRALRMVSSLKNLDADQLGITLSAVAAATRWLASVNTQYNPVFGAWNFLRDTGAAQANLTTTPIAGKQIQVNAGILPALHGIYSALRTGTPKGKWGNLWEEFQQQGGQTGYRNQFAKDREQRNIVERELNKINYGIPRKVANSVFQWLSDYNDSMENAVRLAAYKVGLDNGMTKERSASMAKNLTVNFNRKGQAGQVVGSLYAFFNASAQGTARLAQTLAGPAGRKIAAGGIMIGVIQALALSVRGFKEDEPEDYVKDKNIVIPFADGTYVMIPMPLGLHVFPAFGRIITEGVLAYRRTGNADAGKRGIQLLGVMADAFNPLGSGFSTLALSPTLADPIFALSGNKDPFGRPIAKEDRGTNPTPGYTRSRDTATSVSKWVSEFLNKASGGTKYQKGAISPTPDQLDFLAGQLTGGVGREIMKVEQVIESKFTGEKVPEYKKPIIGKIYGDTKSDPAISNKFYRNITKMADFEHEIVGRAKNKEDVQAFIKEHPESVLWKGANNVENDISELNRMRREMRERKRPKEDIEKLDRKRYEIMQMFNNRVEELEEGRSRTAKR